MRSTTRVLGAALALALAWALAAPASAGLPGGSGLHHGLASEVAEALDAVDQALPPALRPPVWPYLGPDGADVVDRDPGGWPLLGGDYLLGGDEPGKVWPCTWPYLGWGVCGDDVHLPPVIDDSTDHMLEEQLRKASIACHELQERVPLGLPDCGALLRDAAEQVLPNVKYRTDFESVTVEVDPVITSAPEQAPGPALAPAGDAAAQATTDARESTLPDLGASPAPAAPQLREPAPRPLGEGALASHAVPASLSATMGPFPLGPALTLLLGALALALPVLVLYRRILAHRALEHPLRARILELVRAQPGIHESLLARQLGVRHTRVQYHLRVLCDAGLLEVRPFGGLKCLFELGRHSAADKAQAMARHGRTREVLDALAASPGATQRALAQRLAMSDSSVKWHLDRLEDCGFVRTERARGVKRTWAMPVACAGAPVPCAPGSLAATSATTP